LSGEQKSSAKNIEPPKLLSLGRLDLLLELNSRPQTATLSTYSRICSQARVA
jgi:hypothetical protein